MVSDQNRAWKVATKQRVFSRCRLSRRLRFDLCHRVISCWFLEPIIVNHFSLEKPVPRNEHTYDDTSDQYFDIVPKHHSLNPSTKGDMSICDGTCGAFFSAGAGGAGAVRSALGTLALSVVPPAAARLICTSLGRCFSAL